MYFSTYKALKMAKHSKRNKTTLPLGGKKWVLYLAYRLNEKLSVILGHVHAVTIFITVIGVSDQFFIYFFF